MYVPDRPRFVAYTAYSAAGTVYGRNLVTVIVIKSAFLHAMQYIDVFLFSSRTRVPILS